jgi:hypothetical protein
MKRSAIVGIAALLLCALSAGAAELVAVNTGYGSLILGMNLQAGFRYYAGDETIGTDAATGALVAKDRTANYMFTLDRFRLITKGTILTDKIKYFTQTEFNARNVELYDAYLGFAYIPFVQINLGRALPKYGFFVDRSTTDLILIDYPLSAYNWMNPMFTKDQKADARDWRHTGLWFDVKSKYVDAQLGIWNGFTGLSKLNADGTLASWSLQGSNFFADPNDGTKVINGFSSDANSGKDVNLSVVGKPVAGLEIIGSLWWGQPLVGYENKDGEFKEFDNTLWMIGGGAMFRPDWGLLLAAECHWREVQFADFDLNPAPSPAVLNSLAAFGLAGFNFKHYTGVAIEPLVRFDWFDPNTKNDDKVAAGVFGFSDSAHDVVWNITGGVNYYIDALHAVLRLNYIHKDEAWKDVTNKKATDTQTGINNDELKFQAQVSF